MRAGQKSKAKSKAGKGKVDQPPKGQPNIQIVTMEQAILNSLGMIQRTIANIERQQLVLGAKIDACFEKLTE